MLTWVMYSFGFSYIQIFSDVQALSLLVTTLRLGQFAAVNFLFSVLFILDFSHLSLLIVCLYGLVSPPLLLFTITLPHPLVCSPSPSPALSLSLFCPPPPPVSFFLLILLICPSSSLPPPSLPPPCSVRDKFVEVDLKPVCKHCYERLPDDMKRRLAKREHDSKEKKKKTLIPMCL